MSTSAVNKSSESLETEEMEGESQESEGEILETEGDNPLVSDIGHIGRYSCQHCDVVLSGKAELKDHLVMVHKEKVRPRKKIKGVYQCPHCDKSYCFRSKLNNHLGCHVHEKKYSCNLCWKGFSRFSDMFKHRTTHVGSLSLQRVQKFWCMECNAYFQLPSILKAHLQSHVRKRELDTYSDHVSTSALNKSKDPLETEETEGETQESESEAQEMEDDYPLVSYIGYEGRCFCRHCNKVFTGEAKVKDHLVKVHKGKVGARKLIRGVYPCAHCDQSFWYRSRLYEHLWSHTSKKRYSCDICLKGFTRNYDMRVHRRRHLCLRR